MNYELLKEKANLIIKGLEVADDVIAADELWELLDAFARKMINKLNNAKATSQNSLN